MNVNDPDDFAQQRWEVQIQWQKAGKYVPSQEDIDDVCSMVSCNIAAGIADPIPLSSLPSGVAVLELPNSTYLVYWVGDPIVDAIINIPLAELPKFLVHPNLEARKLAKWCMG